MNTILTDTTLVVGDNPGGYSSGTASGKSAQKQVKRRPLFVSRYLAVITTICVVVICYLGNQIHPTAVHCSSAEPIVLAASKTYPAKIRIGTFNVHSLRGRDGVSRPELVAQMIHDSGCDLLFVQEIRSPWIAGNTPQTDQLAGLLNQKNKEQFAAIFLPTEHTWFHPYFGNGLLSRIEANMMQITPLPNTRGKGYRQMIEVDVPLGRQTLHLLCTHLDIVQDHDMQLKLLLEKFQSMPEPKILLGDLNTTRDHPFMKSTFGETAFQAKVDWIIPRGVKARDLRVIEDVQASDHPLVTVEIVEE